MSHPNEREWIVESHLRTPAPEQDILRTWMFSEKNGPTTLEQCITIWRDQIEKFKSSRQKHPWWELYTEKTQLKNVRTGEVIPVQILL